MPARQVDLYQGSATNREDHSIAELMEESLQTEPARRVDSYQGPATNRECPWEVEQEHLRVSPVELPPQLEPWLSPNQANPLEPLEQLRFHQRLQMKRQMDSLETHHSTRPNRLAGENLGLVPGFEKREPLLDSEKMQQAKQLV